MNETQIFRYSNLIGDSAEMYEGKEPYVFISYSHSDTLHMIEIINIFKENHIRYWYDNGLHSGDDVNLVIATHLEKASVFLILLSQASAASRYVKNELNFAFNHRIPIHTLLLEDIVIPIDIEIVIERIKMLTKNVGYEHRLLEALPSELYDAFSFESDKNRIMEHPLFEVDKSEIMKRQGTASYLGKHKTLGYDILVQVDNIINTNNDVVKEQIRLVSLVNHPIFPKIIDITINDDCMVTFQEYRKEIFLDQYLSENKMNQEQIIEWISSVIDAMEYLYSLNLGFRDFASGSLVVLDGKRIGIFRLQNIYYGLVKLNYENRLYYFEKEIEEIAVLLYQLCTGEVPILPFGIIENDSFDKKFMDKVNLIIQKSTKEQNTIKYDSFSQLRDDLGLKRISVRDDMFLRKRRVKLLQYEKIKAANIDKIFTDKNIDIRYSNLEEEFGFGPTVCLCDNIKDVYEVSNIKILICSTGQMFETSKTEILIGRSNSMCDLTFNQPSLSREHAKLYKDDVYKNFYLIEDLCSINGTYLASSGERIPANQKVVVEKGEIIKLGGDIMLKLM